MVYMIPQPYRCPKCAYAFKFSQHHDLTGLGEPFCPECYMRFIRENVPTGGKIDEKDFA